MNSENIKAYIDYLMYERRLSKNTIIAYKKDLNIIISTLKKDLNQLNKDDINNFLKNMDTSSRTKAHYLTVLNSYYNYLIFTGVLSMNPCDMIKSPKIEKKLPVYLTIEEIDKLFNIRLNKPIDYRNKAMLELLFATGTRISELTSLTLSQINFEESIIKVMGKGKKERIIPIANNALNYLKVYIYNYREYLVKNTNEYVFLNKNGEKISRQGFFKILKKMAQDSGINKNISPHVLRHSFATYLLNNGVDLRVIQELLGHENLETTEIYSHLTSQKIKDDYDNHPHAHLVN